MRKKIDPVVDEAIETLNMKDGPSRRRLLEGAGLFSATAAASALIAACSSSSSSSAAPSGTAAAAAGNFPSTPKWKFTFVNHVTDNSFFTPTQYGMADAAALLGLPTPAWTGALSTQPTNSTMLSALQAAITANSPGIATTVVSATAFVAPINSATNAVAETTVVAMPGELAVIAAWRADSMVEFVGWVDRAPVQAGVGSPSSAAASAMPYWVGVKNELSVTWFTNVN